MHCEVRMRQCIEEFVPAPHLRRFGVNAV